MNGFLLNTRSGIEVTIPRDVWAEGVQPSKKTVTKTLRPLGLIREDLAVVCKKKGVRVILSDNRRTGSRDLPLKVAVKKAFEGWGVKLCRYPVTYDDHVAVVIPLQVSRAA